MLCEHSPLEPWKEVLVSPPAGKLILNASFTWDVFIRISFPFNTSSSARTNPPHSSFTRNQISRLQVQPLTVAFLGALRYQILLQCLDLFLHPQVPYFEKPFNSVKCFVSSSALDGEASRRACMRIPRDFLNRDRIVTDCFLNPQRFDGEMFESSTTASEHDGTTRTCIHAMSDTTPVVCENHVSCAQTPKFQRFLANQHTVLASPELKAMRG